MGSDEERTMKIYQELEKITGFRFLNNDEIKLVLKDFVRTGKFDEPKKNAILIMILERLCKLEEDYDILIESLPKVIDKRVDNFLNETKVVVDVEPPNLTAYLTPDLPMRREGKIMPIVESPLVKETTDSLTCPDCGKEAKSKIGLIAHKRSHKTKV